MDATIKKGMNPLLKKGLIAVGIAGILVAGYFLVYKKFIAKPDKPSTTPTDTGSGDATTVANTTPTTPPAPTVYYKIKSQKFGANVRTYASNMGELWKKIPAATTFGVVTQDEWNRISQHDAEDKQLNDMMELVYVSNYNGTQKLYVRQSEVAVVSVSSTLPTVQPTQPSLSHPNWNTMNFQNVVENSAPVSRNN